MNYAAESLRLHREWKGKIEMRTRVPVHSADDLSLAYTPGVAEPCIAIQNDKSLSFELTRRGNMIAVITDGTAVLGLGDIGPEAGMPVMEGKCVLFKAFAGIDAIPICLSTQDTDEIVSTIINISKSFGGINLEDISAPRCFEIERKLKEKCGIPVFHDDQHGTAIVTGAALLNALRIVKKKIEFIKIVINGAGSAGIAIARFLMSLGAEDITLVDRFGIITDGMELSNPAHLEIAKITNKRRIVGGLKDALVNADVFIGVSVGNIVNKDMVKSMAKDPIVFPLANPMPEISRKDALEAGAAVVGTGVSNQPNQINNVLIFPGIFRGALDARAKDINLQMEKAACRALSGLIPDSKLNADYIIPSPLDKRVAPAVAKAVAEAAVKSGISR